MRIYLLVNLSYIVAVALFIFGLKMLTSPATARKGNLVSSLGMLLAVVMTLLSQGIIDYKWIAAGIIAGSIIGVFSARLVAMTQVPEMVAVFNGFGGITSLLVGWATYHVMVASDLFTTATVFLAVLIGGVTFSGSLVAWGKLAAYISGRPILFTGQTVLNGAVFIGTLVAGTFLLINPSTGYPLFIGIIIMSLVLGILLTISIGGADMPVVVSLLNSYSGIAGCAAGLAIQNNILIVAGAPTL